MGYFFTNLRTFTQIILTLQDMYLTWKCCFFSGLLVFWGVMQTGDSSKGDPKTGSFQAYHLIWLNHEVPNYPRSPYHVLIETNLYLLVLERRWRQRLMRISSFWNTKLYLTSLVNCVILYFSCKFTVSTYTVLSYLSLCNILLKLGNNRKVLMCSLFWVVRT